VLHVSGEQLWQVAPLSPHALLPMLAAGVHVEPSAEQQPVQPEPGVGSHLHAGAGPLVSQNMPAPHAADVPHMQTPVVHRFALRGSHVMVHAPPGRPQLMLVIGEHELPEPHDAESQTHDVPEHVEPFGHAAAPPQVHAPAVHASPDGKPPAVTQSVQVAPPEPHCEAVVEVTHVTLLAQQPAHDDVVHAHAPSTHASPLGHAEPPGPHEH
jgi:hypothetical protein